MTSLQELLPLDLSAPGQEGTLVVHYDACVVAMREYLSTEADAVLAVALRLQQRRPNLSEQGAWDIAQRSVMAGILHRVSGWPEPMEPATRHLRLEEEPMLSLIGSLLAGVHYHQAAAAQHQVEEDPDD